MALTLTSKRIGRLVYACRPTRSIGPSRYSSTVHENDPELLDREKKRNLAGLQHQTSTPHSDHAPGWNEYLASSSEASVKADKSSVSTAEELQKTTIEYVRKRHPLDEEATLSTQAVEEMGGPLRSAQGSHEQKSTTVRRTERETVKRETVEKV